MHNNAKFAFYYLLSLVALVFVTVAAGTVVFQIINQTVVDNLANYADRANQEALRFAVASLVFAVPVYFWMIKLINRGLAGRALAETAGIKRWLTYLIIFVASVIILVWLIMTLNSFLNGELTWKFALKTVTVLFIAGTTFSYYLYDARLQNWRAKDPVRRWFAGGAVVLAAAALTAGCFYLDSPTKVRDQRHDQTVLDNLQEIDGALNQYYDLNQNLPSTLNDLADTNGLSLRNQSLADPLSQKPYGYQATEADIYRLCADFKLASDSQDKSGLWSWNHQAGWQCFERRINKIKDVPEAAPIR